MASVTIYVHPDNESHTGYASFAFTSAGTSSYEDCAEGHIDKEEKISESEEKNILPEQEQPVLDEALIKYYGKKGYKV